jgi:hypothetical protein
MAQGFDFGLGAGSDDRSDQKSGYDETDSGDSSSAVHSHPFNVQQAASLLIFNVQQAASLLIFNVQQAASLLIP